MSVGLYMDEHVPRAITEGLRLRGVDVLTAQEDNRRRASDPELLDRAAELGRILFTQDSDLLREAKRRQRTGKFFADIIYAHPLKVTIGECIEDLTLLAKVGEPEDFANQVIFLPLK
ncbi:MAG: hypothetical protein DFNUSKGM_001616 [Candidatus Fervidibacter sacchari]|jgi:Protein of unknown function DUF82.